MLYFDVYCGAGTAVANAKRQEMAMKVFIFSYVLFGILKRNDTKRDVGPQLLYLQFLSNFAMMLNATLKKAQVTSGFRIHCCLEYVRDYLKQD